MNILEIIFWAFVALVFYTYIGYGIVLYLMVKVKELFVKQKKNSLPDEADLPEVTLLVAAYNEEAVVKEKMETRWHWTIRRKNCFSYGLPMVQPTRQIYCLSTMVV